MQTLGLGVTPAEQKEEVQTEAPETEVHISLGCEGNYVVNLSNEIYVLSLNS